MKWETIKYELREFQEDLAIEGDMYIYHNGKLEFVCSAMVEPGRKSLISKIRSFFWRKRNGGIVSINRRTLEYIYNVCKGIMPTSKGEFVECVMSTIPNHE